MWFFIAGFMIGLANPIPGVSGGTMALVMGVYEETLDAIDDLFKRKWGSLKKLAPMGIGIVTAVFAFSKLMEYSLAHHPTPTKFFFLGLVLVSFVRIAKNSSSSGKNVLLGVVGGVLIVSLRFLKISHTGELSLFGAFLAGTIGAFAMVVPGVSGSLVLLALGLYEGTLRAVAHVELFKILALGVGIALGLLLSVKAMRFLLKNYRKEVYSFIAGMVLASVLDLWPTGKVDLRTGIWSISTFLGSILLMRFLSKLEGRFTSCSRHEGPVL